MSTTLISVYFSGEITPRLVTIVDGFHQDDNTGTLTLKYSYGGVAKIEEYSHYSYRELSEDETNSALKKFDDFQLHS